MPTPRPPTHLTVSRARDERTVHHLPAKVQAWYNTEVINGFRNPHERPSHGPERPGLFPIVDAVRLNLSGAHRHEWDCLYRLVSYLYNSCHPQHVQRQGVPGYPQLRELTV